jgi:hypothetical protein
MTAEQMAKLQKALYAATKVADALKVKVTEAESVTNEDGLAVFRSADGKQLGFMNWGDYEEIQRAKRKKAERK